jgi:hypothetical protein
VSGFAKSATYAWALTAIFGAFHLVLTFLPYSVLGTGGGFLTWGMVSAPIVGFLLGPFYGTISVLVGSLVGTSIFNLGGDLGPIIPVIAPTAGAFTAGALRTGRVREVFLVYVIAIVGYILGPIGTSAFVFLWLHLVAFFIVIVLLIPGVSDRLKASVTFERGRNLTLMPVAIFLFSFIALLADHVVGSTLGVYYYHYVLGYDASTLSGIWLSLTFVYPFERIVATIVLGLIVIAAGEAIAQTGFELPVSPWDKGEQLELSPDEVENG